MTRALHITGIIVVLLLLAFPRLLALDATRSPDEDRWMANTAGFTRKLAHGQWRDLIQQPHPGITTQWLGALTIRFDNWQTRKLPIVVGNVLLILTAGYVFGRLWGWSAGLFTILALGFDPLLYAHTRVYAMDAPLALFSIISLGLLFLWQKEREIRYLAAAGFTAAAAGLSKLPGFMLLPFTLLLLTWWSISTPRVVPREGGRPKGIPRGSLKRSESEEAELTAGRQGPAATGPAVYVAAFLAGLILILPSFALAPRGVIGEFGELFRSDEYQKKHQLETGYYLRTLIFFSAPLQLGGLFALAFAVRKKRISRQRALQLAIIALFAALFFIQMTLGAKKGDRYILPTFAALDIIAAAGFAAALRAPAVKVRRLTLTAGVLLLAWQTGLIWQLHPHNLAYINPLTRSWFGERRHGWGEGLNLAAEYLNQKPNAEQLKVAAYYPSEFSAFFIGETVPAHQHEKASVDYVVLYRAMLQRGPDAWETDVLNHYRTRQPEHVIRLSGIDFIWIYKNK